MIKYFLFTLGSLGSLMWESLMMKIYAPNTAFNPLLLDYIPSILLSISAGLFLIQKTKNAGVISLIGLSIASKSILISWFGIKFLQPAYITSAIFFFSFCTFFLFFLGYISIQGILNPDKKQVVEFNNYYPKGLVGIIIRFIPLTLVIAGITIGLGMHH